MGEFVSIHTPKKKEKKKRYSEIEAAEKKKCVRFDESQANYLKCSNARINPTDWLAKWNKFSQSCEASATDGYVVGMVIQNAVFFRNHIKAQLD